MAKTLSKTGIGTGNTVKAGHITQSIDALTGDSAYDITVSGSLTVTGSLITPPGQISTISSSYAVTASHALNAGGGGGTNIGNSDLTISAAGTRELRMAGALSTDIFKLRDSANAFDMFAFGGDGGQAIGWKAENTGTNRWGNTIVGNLATNNGNFASTVIGSQAYTNSLYGTAVGYQAKAGWNATALGVGANASNGQYNISIGESANCSAYYNVAIGRSSVAYNKGVAIGGNATQANGEDSVAIGYNAQTIGNLTSRNSVVIGSQASCTNNMSVVMGCDADSTAAGTVVIGSGVKTSASYSVVLGALAYGQTRTNTDANAFAVYLQDTDPTIKFHTDNDSWFDSIGSFGYGTMTPDASAAVDITSTTKGFLPPRMTTAEMNAISTPAAGLMVYDTTTNQWMGYNGTSWTIIG